MDVYGELGKQLKEIWDVQHYIFESVMKEGLKMVKYEYEVKEMEK